LKIVVAFCKKLNLFSFNHPSIELFKSDLNKKARVIALN
jgi:hypothetical protein